MATHAVLLRWALAVVTCSSLFFVYNLQPNAPIPCILEADVGTGAKLFAFVFYLAQESYHCAALVNVQRLLDLGKRPDIDVVFMVSQSLSLTEAARSHALALGVRYKLVDALELGEMTNEATADFVDYYWDSMLKLHAFNLTEYQRVLFLDADQLVLRNLDVLFTSIPSADLAAPRAYWLLPGEFPEGYQSAGWAADNGPEVGPQMKFGSYAMLIEPSSRLWTRLHGKYYPGNRPSFTDMFDMDLLNFEFKDEVVLLPGGMVISSTDFLSEEGDTRPANVQQLANITAWFNNAYILHFCEPGKVWTLRPKELGSSHHTLRTVWEDWWEIRDRMPELSCVVDWEGREEEAEEEE